MEKLRDISKNSHVYYEWSRRRLLENLTRKVKKVFSSALEQFEKNYNNEIGTDEAKWKETRQSILDTAYLVIFNMEKELQCYNIQAIPNRYTFLPTDENRSEK